MDLKRILDNQSTIVELFQHENVKNRHVATILCTELDKNDGSNVLKNLTRYLHTTVSLMYIF